MTRVWAPLCYSNISSYNWAVLMAGDNTWCFSFLKANSQEPLFGAPAFVKTFVQVTLCAMLLHMFCLISKNQHCERIVGKLLNWLGSQGKESHSVWRMWFGIQEFLYNSPDACHALKIGSIFVGHWGIDMRRLWHTWTSYSRTRVSRVPAIW